MKAQIRGLVPKWVRRSIRSAEVGVRETLGLVDSDDKLVRDPHDYWNATGDDGHRYVSHWRGGGDFADDERWLSIDREHLSMFERFARGTGIDRRPFDRIVEWGCGGGANAVHFGTVAREFVGVDIVQSTLDECGRQMAAVPACTFVPLLVASDNPEAAAERFAGSCDAFVSYYVFEALPSPAYALRVLKVAHRMLADGRLAVIQVKYRTADRSTSSRRWSYASNLAHNATFAIDEFWKEARAIGFCPEAIKLVPEAPVVRDGRYAYFALRK